MEKKTTKTETPKPSIKTIKFSSGDIYTGEFKNNTIEGKGELIFVDGNKTNRRFISKRRIQIQSSNSGRFWRR